MEYGLIGEKLGHSFSKEIHAQIGSYEYVLKEIPKNELTAFMQKKDFKGINVTIPYKQDVIPFLDFIDDAAKEIGAVNTIVNKNGKLYGYNTDFIGLKRLIISTKLELKGKKVLILGTGGTSKTATAAAKSLGAKEIIIVSRKESSETVTYEQAQTIHKDAQIILNTTPAGMYPNIDAMPISLDSFSNLEGIVDVIYNPLRTQLVLKAQKMGLKANGGLYMLVQQAIAAAEYFFDKPIEDSKADTIFKNMLSQKQNIVLIGMPGCGKSTVGRKLAKQLNMTLFDTDEEIKTQQGMTPSEIITNQGEPAFRQIEAEICAQLATKNNVIISTGGGAILREENVVHLKNNGLLFFIDRDLEKIRPTGDRPLSNSTDKLKAVYEYRYPIYKACADFHIKSDDKVEHTVNVIKNVFLGGSK
ncbi:MAG: AAA family ATPase [Treponema sp.]|nr:AAA family ATPase [Treponema sp.]